MRRLLLIVASFFFFSLQILAQSTAPVITATTVTGNMSACIGTAAASPSIQQFYVSGSALTSAVTATAPTGFEISLNAGSGYSSSLTLNQYSGNLGLYIIYIRSAAGDPVGSISGNVVLSSAGIANVNITVGGTVNALPIANHVPNQTVTAGTATTAINFIPQLTAS